MPKLPHPWSWTLSALSTIETHIHLESLPRLYTRFLSSSSLGVPSDDHIVHLILDQKSAEAALETFLWASKLPHFTHSQSTYRALIHKLCAFRRFHTVNQLLDEMPNALGMPPDEDILVTLVRGLGRARMIPDVIKVLDLASTFHKTPSLKIFNSILDVLVKEDIDLARHFYRRKMMSTGVQELMEESRGGSRGNISPYNSVLYGLYKENRLEEALEFLSKMENLFPRAVDRSLTILGFCEEGRLEDAKRVYDQMTREGGISSVIVYDCLIRGFCVKGCVQEAVEVMNEMVVYGYFPVTSTVNAVLGGFCSQGKVGSALKLMEDMVGRGCIPDEGSYSLLINGFCRNGDVQKAEKKGSGVVGRQTRRIDGVWV
ncbi:hypothetical protein CCACVL1_00569 [Corchorus capsularis]|uniref:Pentacotripeptide-repeat region of PRORP domain-containing protein n=1 Tax=Corchorus capsularis TaxID=210143 RepID=A0A1R3KW73_COCAP|nr:hypothetical protein CCACVL1_00569 [Corchorus capsularis]